MTEKKSEINNPVNDGDMLKADNSENRGGIDGGVDTANGAEAVCGAKKKGKRGGLIGGAAVLAAGSIAAKIIGALYRIPLTNILGAEGMGLYQLVFPVFALFMTLSIGGIPTALSRIVAEKKAFGEGAKRYLVAAVTSLLSISVLFAALVAGLSRQLATWQGNGSSYAGFLIIAPAIPLVGIVAAFRGWFQGEMYMVPTALSNVIEQVVKLAAGITLALLLKDRGVTASVCGALVGVTLSEVVAAAYLFITYLIRGRNSDKERLRVTRSEAGSMFRVAFPIAMVSVLMPLSNFFDSLIIVNMLKLSGVETGVATAQYGLMSATVSSLINMPVVIIMSLAVAIVPSVSVSRVERNIDAILTKSKLSIKLTYLIGVPSAFIFAVFSREILGIIYPALSDADLKTASDLLLICSANVVTLSAMQIYISLLQALDRTKSAVLSLVFAIIVKVVLSLALVRFIGISGAAVASVAMAAAALAATNISFYKLTSLRLEKNIGTILFSGVIMSLTAMSVKWLIKNDIAALVVGFILSAAVYVWLVTLFNAVDEDDARHLPLGKLFLKFRRIVRFWDYGESK